MDENQPRIQAQSSLGSDTNSEQSECIEPANASRTICLIGAAADNPDTLTAAKAFVGATIVTSETGSEHLNDSSTVFILPNFENEIFDALYKAKRILLGHPALQQLSTLSPHPTLPINTRPLYSLAMSGVVVCVTGFRDKDTLGELVTIVHQLGGSIRKDLSQKVTHLIANYTGGAKYVYADTFRLPVMMRTWVTQAWQRREERGFVATEELFLAEHKLRPFYGARVCFLGFAEEEEKDMINVLQENGGAFTTIEDPTCTHVVMDPDYVVTATANSDAAPTAAYLETATNHEQTPPPTLTPSPEPSIQYNMNVDGTPLHNSTMLLLPTVTEDGLDDDVREVKPTRKRKFLSPSDRRLSIFDSKRNKKDVSLTNSESRVTRRMSKMFLTPLDYFANRRRTIGITLNDSLNASIASTSTLFETSTMTNLNESNRPPRANLFTRSANKLLNRRKSHHNMKSAANLNSTAADTSLNTSIYPNDNICNTTTALLKTNPVKIPAIVLSPAFPLDVDMATATTNMADKMDSKMVPPKLLTIHKEAVVDDGGAPTASITDKTDSILRAHLVKAEWFWTSVQKETCLPEKNYMFEGHIDGIVSPTPTPSSHPSTSTPSSSTPTHTHTPSSASRRKRKRLHETLSSLAQATTPHHLKPTSTTSGTSSPRLLANNRQQSLNIEGITQASASSIKQRRSSSDALGLSVTGGSFVLDCTASPGPDVGVGQMVGPQIGGKGEAVVKESKRQQVFQELVHTESNYVNILQTIVTTFKKHLEDAEPPDQLLNPTELKIIFGRVPLIYTTHLHMLNALRSALGSYSDASTSIGDIILRYSTDLLHAYPPFINAYEDMKVMLEKCDREKPRFHAFLKACQTRPECGRQGLGELMIRPVQRLGSISLLLNDILKHTMKTHPDHSLLVQALASIKEVLAHINEDKRKAEGQRVMFDIFNEIDNCPPDVVSSHRSFVARCDVIQLSSSDNTITTSKGTPLCLFLFSDQLGICKRRNNHRSNSFNPPTNHQPTIKSPTSRCAYNNNQQHLPQEQSVGSSNERLLMNGTIGGAGHHKLAVSGGGMNGGGVGVKSYKHVKLMSLSAIRRVIDIKDTEDCQRVCSFIFMNNGELKEKLFSFAIADDEVDKTSFLKTLCHQMATNACTADSEKFMAYCEAQQLDIDTSYLHGTLSKAVKFAHRTRLKVGRAFSFNKTPAKLKRAVSSMMSPFGSSNNLTPASQLAQMRLASYSNIHELGHTASTDSASIAPLSVQPTRKMKPSSLGVSVLKRL